MAGYDDWKASILPEQMEGKTLDAGFGTGFASNIAAERGSQVTAIEPHVDGIECSKLRPIHNGSGPSNIRWYRASVYNCSQFGRFNHVVFFDVLYHLTAPQDSLFEIYRALEAGGTCYLCTLYVGGDAPVMVCADGTWAGDITNWFVPTIPAVEMMAKRAGFEFKEFARSSDRLLALLRRPS